MLSKLSQTYLVRILQMSGRWFPWHPKGGVLKLSDQIKYLGIYLDKYLNGHYQSKLVIQKLARAIGMLSKVRHYAPKSEIKNIYHATFESDLRCQIWFLSNYEFTKTK